MFCAGLCFLKKRRQISHIASSQLVALTEVAMRRQRFFFYSMVYQDVSNSPTAQRFFTLLLTLCAIGFLWINGIPLRPALQAHVLRLFSRNDVDESAFDRFFMEEKVAKFMADYRRNCRPERFLFAAHFGMTYQNVGFGSYINTQLNYFILMHEKYNVDKYQFQIVIYNWVYETLESYFDDFARDTACPLFRNINSTEFEALRKNESFGLIYANGSLPISSNRSVIALHMAPLYWPRRSEVGKWCQSVGYDYCLSKKQIVTKALWQPKPPLKELLRTLWRNILDNKHRFLAVHIRRGSKIAGPSKEVNEVPVDQFVKKIQHVCQRLGPECPKTVYLMHDEEWVFPKLQTLLNTSFQVYNFWTLLNRSRITWDENLISDSASDPGNIHRAPRAGWAWRTKQVILEITIISMSNELICTYSSNICKLAAVLRGNHTSRIYSMDQPNWDPF